MSRISSARFTCFRVLSEKTLLFLGDFDGEFSQLMADFAKLAGPVFDAKPAGAEQVSALEER